MVVHGRPRERRLPRVVDPRRWHKLVSVRSTGYPKLGSSTASRGVRRADEGLPISCRACAEFSERAEDENLPSNLHHEKPWWVKKTPLWARMKWFPSREHQMLTHGRVVGRPQVARASRASWSTTGLSSHASTGLRMKLFSASVAATLPMSSMSTSGLYLGVRRHRLRSHGIGHRCRYHHRRRESHRRASRSRREALF